MNEPPAEPRPGDGVPTVATPQPESQPAATAKPPVTSRASLAQLVLALFIVLAASVVVAVHFHSYFSDSKFRASLLTEGLRGDIAARLPHPISLLSLVGPCAMAAIVAWLVGGLLIKLVSRKPLLETWCRWGRAFCWLWLFGLFELLWSWSGSRSPGTSGWWLGALAALVPFFHVIAWGGWLAAALVIAIPDREPGRFRRALAHPAVAWVAAAGFAMTFSLLAILQYRALMVPHGDSAMYEEHLWNLLHGKGFRSQLDDGRLFFGEHLEVIHLLLAPIYVLFPSLVALNVCLSVGLASGAVAVRGITRRLTGSGVAANWLAVAYVLYFPLQYLNLEASMKTFRPENLGVPLLLFAIWSLESGRWRTMLALMGLALLAKEDYAIPVAMLGLYLTVRPRGDEAIGGNDRAARWLGAGVFVGSAFYLVFVLTVFIPYFRGGVPHYTSYYKDLGSSPGEIVLNLVRDPRLLFARLATFGNLLFILSLTVPLGGLPLAGVGRLWVLLPGLVSVLLSDREGMNSPLFHFHAPLLPIVFWAAAEGARRLKMEDGGLKIEESAPKSAGSLDLQSSILYPRSSILRAAPFCILLATACAFTSGVLFGKSPLSFAFYDPHSDVRGFGIRLYHRSERSERFKDVFALVPPSATVAATDYVRPRFTHHRECHQFGEGGFKPHVPADSIDYIVLDLQGPYSNWLQARREIEARRELWDVIYDDGWFFLVFRAKRLSSTVPNSKEASR